MATTIFLRDYSDIQDYVKYKDGKLVREEGAAKDATVEMLKTIMNDVQENAQGTLDVSYCIRKVPHCGKAGRWRRTEYRIRTESPKRGTTSQKYSAGFLF
ncbi:MAG: hypothetical protein LIO99_14780 [Clostridiales bacterium]|nr:hypothetical protein [Clostridiales bacterium]